MKNNIVKCFVIDPIYLSDPRFGVAIKLSIVERKINLEIYAMANQHNPILVKTNWVLIYLDILFAFLRGVLCKKNHVFPRSPLNIIK